MDGLSLAIGADNLFDVYPDRSPFGARSAAIGGVYPANQQYIPFSIFSPFGFNGRYLCAGEHRILAFRRAGEGEGARG